MMKKTLQDISKKLTRENFPWLLAGKTAAVLQGALLKSTKLTLYTTQLGSYRFGEYFHDYKKMRVKYRENPPLSGHAGIFSINDIEIAVVGDPEITYQHRKYPIPLLEILEDDQSFSIDDMEIPLLPLPWLFVLGVMGKDEELAAAVATSGVTKEDIQKVTDNLGISFYLKSEIDRFLT